MEKKMMLFEKITSEVRSFDDASFLVLAVVVFRELKRRNSEGDKHEQSAEEGI